MESEIDTYSVSRFTNW